MLFLAAPAAVFSPVLRSLLLLLLSWSSLLLLPLLLALLLGVSRKEEFPGVIVKLVLMVASVFHSNNNKLFITIIITPMCNSGRQCNNIALSEVSNLLMLVTESLALSSSFAVLFRLLGGLVCFRTTRTHHPCHTPSLDNVDEFRSIGVRGQEKASGLDNSSVNGDVGALELVIFVVPELGHTGFGLNPVLGLLSSESPKLALPSLLLPLALLLASCSLPGNRALEQKKKT